jgi:hypothetical protein
MEPIEVTAHFDKNGKAAPLRFTWKKSTYLVESTGRQWQDERGQHFLVMVMGGRMFELLFVCEERRWYLGRVGPGPALV